MMIVISVCFSIPSQAAPPDLTAGGVPGDTRDFNLGPTGARGWAYHVSKDTSESRQILVTAIEAGSPADGLLAEGDVILGADGLGTAPVNFIADARKSLATAIADAEAQSPATLKLLRWRADTTSVIDITLQTLGTYSATAPYSCPKSQLILQQGLAHVMNSETAGRYSFGTLSLLAGNDPSDPENTARMARAQTEMQSLIPNAATITELMSDQRDASSVWQRGHTLIALAEYYLLTNDATVLPAIEAYSVNISRNHSMFGTAGHIYAEKNKDGSDNGPMGGGYGAVNSSGLPCYLGLLLARECGLTHPGFDANTENRVEAAITRAGRFFGYYAGRGAIPYGEHTPSWNTHESNGKSGLAALCFALEDARGYEEKFNVQMAVAATNEREIGHTGSWFNYIWSPLGAATGGEEAASSHFRRISWHLDLCRRWDGGFVYDSLYGEGPQGGQEYHDFRMSTAALLLYSLPLRQLHITGRGDDPTRDLNTVDIADAEFADDYNASTRGTNDLINDLGSWSPKVHLLAAEQLATRTIDTATLAQLTTMATDPAGTSRLGATYTLGKINNSTTANSRAATLASLLTDPENHVRYIAADAMRYLPLSAKMTQLNAVLSAAASTAPPFLPFNEEDPMHMAHGRLCMLLFYGGNAYGPKGMIWGSGINGVDRGLLYPAFRAVAANPVGQARSTLQTTYDYLTAADMNALADSIVDSIYHRPPADKMFSAGSRTGGIKALQRFNIAEGVPLSMEYIIDDGRSSNITVALGVLEDYAGSSTLVRPDHNVIQFCKDLLQGANAADALAVLNAIDADTNAIAPIPYKSIQSVTSDSPSVTLPANQTGLHVSASDYAEGDLVYTWRKVHGAGNPSFSPNGTAASKDTTVTFDNVPGQYLFEVTVSDSRGFTEVSDTVAVTLYNTGGTLPPNDPPTADPQSITTSPATITPIILTGSDPENYELVFKVTSPPSHGTLSGIAPNIVYTSDESHLGSDSFTFEAMDSEGQTSSATIDITVDTSAVELYAYEPFDYTSGSNVDTTLDGGSGFATAWTDAQNTGSDSITVYDETGFWDGIVDNVTTNPATGSRYISSAGTPGAITAQRTLSQNAGAMAGNDKTLWASVVWRMNGSNYGRQVGFVLGTDGISNRSQSIDTSGNFGAGLGDAIGVGGAINTLAVTPTIWDNGAISARTTVGAAEINTSMENLVVLKFVFADGTEPDRVYAYRFTEAETINESVFENSAIHAESVIDQNTLNILSFSQTNRGAEAIDEIRIGNSFASVIGIESSPPDSDPPSLGPANIVDNRTGEAVTQNTPVAYSVTFSEAIDGTTVTSADFANAGSSDITINSILQSLPNVFIVDVTPINPGSLQLQVNTGAIIIDLAGNPLDTTAAIVDDTTITVNELRVPVPDVTEMTQSSAESEITSAGLAVGTITSKYHASVPSGSVISQNPSGGINVPLQTAVSLVISAGPSNGNDYALADLPVSGEITGSTTNTQTSDGVYQSLRELSTKGKPNSRISYLEHKWIFEIGVNNSLTFFIEAHHTSNNENDHFVFAYSTTGINGPYTDMLTVTKTSDNNTPQSFVMPANTSGTIHVRVLDTDRSGGKDIQDTLYIDQMYFFSESGPIMETVPDVIGLSQTSAELNIGASSLGIGAVASEYSNTVAANHVIGQNPVAGESVEQGSNVDMIISLGPMPDYMVWQDQFPGADLDDASADFDGDGLKNDEERLWGRDPTKANSRSPFITGPNPSGNFRYTRRDPSLTGATFTIWVSPNLLAGSWTLDAGASQVSEGVNANNVETISVTLSSGHHGADRLFIRIEAAE